MAECTQKVTYQTKSGSIAILSFVSFLFMYIYKYLVPPCIGCILIFHTFFLHWSYYSERTSNFPIM